MHDIWEGTFTKRTHTQWGTASNSIRHAIPVSHTAVVYARVHRAQTQLERTQFGICEEQLCLPLGGHPIGSIHSYFEYTYFESTPFKTSRETNVYIPL